MRENTPFFGTIFATSNIAVDDDDGGGEQMRVIQSNHRLETCEEGRGLIFQEVLEKAVLSADFTNRLKK